MTASLSTRPSFTLGEIRTLVRNHYGIDGTTEPLPSYCDQNIQLDTREKGRFVVKIANRSENREVLDFQNAAMNLLSEIWSSGNVPRVIKSLAGQFLCPVIGSDGEQYWMRVLTFLPGRLLSTVLPRSELTLERLGYALGELDRCLADFQHPAMERELQWDLPRAEWISSHTRRIPDIQRRGIVERILLQFRARVTPILPDLPMSVIHNDANDENVLLTQDSEGEWKFAGLFDFEDMLRTHTVNELAIACAYAILRTDDPLDVAAAITAGYHRARPLSEAEIQVLFPLLCIRLCVSVTSSALAVEDDPHNEHRHISEGPAWEMLERLDIVDWCEAENRFRKACGLKRRPEAHFGKRQWAYEELLKERRERIGPSLTLLYKTPLEIVRGRGQFLFEPGGRAYLDCVNNVCHVGHCHPKVAAALSRQADLLNTNTRYLHPYLVEYAERLTATLPESLSVCFFVNSGSEANELAVRMARTYTGRRDVIVVEDGYHGNTQTMVDLSPYKCEGPGGRGLPEWAHKVVKPDSYRGPHCGGLDETGRVYAEYVRQMCELLIAENRPPTLFLCESILGCGGQIVLPDGYLRETFDHVRSAGGVCVVDEVQVGLGRVGSHMWAFETQGVVPDIVTMGKPIGNGHPLGAVVTTPEIAQSFADRMEFFSSFGGNPVSMAVGLAVLDVIEEEGLRERATRVGRYLIEGFRALGEHHPEIGDVRGLGLFMGVELVRDHETRTPVTKETARLIELVKSEGILLGAEGPHHNVLKIKPPMQFQETDADLLLGAVDRALHEIRVRCSVKSTG